MIVIEVALGKMAQDAGHCYGTTAPLWEIEIELVVLDILAASD